MRGLLKALNKGLANISIYRKFWVLTVIGIALPLVVIFFFMFNQLISQFDERNLDRMDFALGEVEEDVTNQYDIAESLLATYINDHSLEDTLYSYDNDTSGREEQAYLELVSSMSSDIQAYEWIDNITIYHSNGALDYNWLVRPVNEDEGSDRLMTFLKEGKGTFTQQEGGKLAMYGRLNKIDRNDVSHIRMVLNQELLDECLYEERIDEQLGQVFLLSETGQVLASTMEEAGVEAYNAYAMMPDKIVLLSDVEIDDDTTWDLVVFLEEVPVFERENDTVRDIALLGSGVIAFALAFSYIVSRSIIDRINTLSSTMADFDNHSLTLIEDDLGQDEIGKSVVVYNKMVNQINDLIHMDQLTGLMNRRMITKRIDQICSDGEETLMAVGFLDIDNFKHINDTYGHSIGDQVIRATAELICNTEGVGTDIGRFGGDEFLVLIHGQNLQDIEEICQRIKGSFAKTITVSQIRFQLTVSMGVAIHPKDGCKSEDLIRRADQALYYAKNCGRNQYRFFSEDMSNAAVEKLNLQGEIRQAFAENQFFLNFQPVYSSNGERCLGYESLIRWISPIRGYVSPMTLIQNVEEIGMIFDVGQWVFYEACKFLASVNDNSEPSKFISINVSALQLEDDRFFESVTGIVKELGIDPSLVVIEITETVMINAVDTKVTILDDLRDFGFSIALDDFGTGYSSLLYFSTLPLDVIKIDRGFTANVTNQGNESDIIKFIIEMAHNRDMTVVAEGIETPEQLALLKDMGCDVMQGYLLSHPLSKEEILD